MARIRLPQRSRSSLRNRAISAGVLPTASRLPISVMRFATSGSFRTSATAAETFSVIAAGVFGGAAMANQVTERNPGKPDSAIVGNSFTESTRSGLASSPISIRRDVVSLQSVSTPGLFPAGEGAGYAGGILSAAIDGIQVAEAVALDWLARRPAGSPPIPVP